MAGASARDFSWPSAELVTRLELVRFVPKGGRTVPECPACGFVFDRMPQRKRACPGCKLAIYSRKCPVRGKALWLEGELDGLERAWALHGAGAELCREDLADSLDSWIGAQFAAMADGEATQDWGLAHNGWVRIAGGCARRLLPALAAHALAGAIVLDISDAGNGFGAVRDQHHFIRELALRNGTQAPPLPYDPAHFVPDATQPWVWHPRVPVRSHTIGQVYPALVRALERFCAAGELDMQFVRRSLELHAAAMTQRGALVVPVDLAWKRFVVLAQRAAG